MLPRLAVTHSSLGRQGRVCVGVLVRDGMAGRFHRHQRALKTNVSRFDGVPRDVDRECPTGRSGSYSLDSFWNRSSSSRESGSMTDARGSA
jgi:hypothetical protein